MRINRPTCVASLAFAAVFLTSMVVGCSSGGPPTGRVQGKVTFKGNPVTEGNIQFLNPKEGGTAGAELNKDGTYVVPNPVVVGEYLVTVSPLTVIVDTDPGKSPPAPVEKPAPNIPQKVRQQGSTHLRATVKTGQNEHNFDLSK